MNRRGSRRRACVVRHSYYPSELNLKREAEALRDEGFDVSVICLRREDEPSRETVEGVEVYRMPVGHRRGAIPRYLLEYNFFFVLATFRLLMLHVRRRVSVVQINTMPDYLVFVALLPRLTGARVVLHVHEPMPELFGTLFPGRKYAPLVAAIRFSERISIAFADRVLTVTEQMKQRLVERGADASKITVILNVPDTRVIRASETDAVVPSSDEAPYILTHGAIEERYGPDVIVRAMALLREDLPELEFHLLGAGDYVEELLALVANLGVSERVRYLGFVPHATMIAEVSHTVAGIVPMQSNPYSNLVHTNKMYEYIELGRPVIASRLDSVAAYFGDDAIAYFTPGDPADLARRVRETVADPEAAQRRAARAREVYAGIRWDHERERYLEVYRGLVPADGPR
ncbi:MAG: glycosyltransferase family 4 protein [Dehalococcoidia bacterium]